MDARTRRRAGLTSGSMKATVEGAVIASAMMVLAGCGGFGGSAAEPSAPAVRGDVASSDTSDPGFPGFTFPLGWDVAVPENVFKYEPGGGFFPKGEGEVEILAEEPGSVVVGDSEAFETVVKPPNGGGGRDYFRAGRRPRGRTWAVRGVRG